MARWGDFQVHAPAMAAAARDLFDRFEVVMLGTTSESGAARLSLVEPRIVGADLVIDDRKTADLRRVPRCTIHTLVSHRTHEEAVFKATLHCDELTGTALAGTVSELACPESDWLPTGVFSCDIQRAVLIGRG